MIRVWVCAIGMGMIGGGASGLMHVLCIDPAVRLLVMLMLCGVGVVLGTFFPAERPR